MALWNNTDTTNSEPKNLTSAEKVDVFGVDVAEAKTAENIAKGLNTPGWVKYKTYTDAQGNTRHKSEVLVAMSSISGDNDVIAPEITITVQPTDLSLAQGASGVFSVTATKTGDGTLAYQWQKAEAETPTEFVNVGPSSNTYSTGIVSGLENGDKFRVIVSLAGAQSVTSNTVTLTVA